MAKTYVDRPESNWLVVSKTLALDDRLTDAERGFMLRLLAKTGRESLNAIRGGKSYSSTKKMLSQLANFGYLKIRHENGDTVYVIASIHGEPQRNIRKIRRVSLDSRARTPARYLYIYTLGYLSFSLLSFNLLEDPPLPTLSLPTVEIKSGSSDLLKQITTWVVLNLFDLNPEDKNIPSGVWARARACATALQKTNNQTSLALLDKFVVWYHNQNPQAALPRDRVKLVSWYLKFLQNEKTQNKAITNIPRWD